MGMDRRRSEGTGKCKHSSLWTPNRGERISHVTRRIFCCFIIYVLPEFGKKLQEILHVISDDLTQMLI